MVNNPPQKRGHLMNSSNIRINMVNLRSRFVYDKGKDTRGQILKKFVQYLIKSDMWFQILKCVSHRRLIHPKTLEKILKVPSANYGKELYLYNTTRKMLNLFGFLYQLNNSLMEQRSSRISLLQVLMKLDVMMHGN